MLRQCISVSSYRLVHPWNDLASSFKTNFMRSKYPKTIPSNNENNIAVVHMDTEPGRERGVALRCRVLSANVAME